jgi:DNA-binding CsgD family transcriptional regulator
LAEGRTNEQIADVLHESSSQVRTDLESMFAKLAGNKGAVDLAEALLDLTVGPTHSH